MICDVDATLNYAIKHVSKVLMTTVWLGVFHTYMTLMGEPALT
jgi:hypothetical protein